jgi:hypothetical protein
MRGGWRLLVMARAAVHLQLQEVLDIGACRVARENFRNLPVAI